MPHALRDTQFARSSGWDHQLEQVVTFLIMNRAICLSPDTVDQIAQTKTIIQTPISAFFDRLVFTGCLRHFASIYPVNVPSVPDLLTMPGVCIDLADCPQGPAGHALASFSNLHKKVLINLSGLVKFRDDMRTPQVQDLTELQSLYVRGLLCRSYSASDGWLTPALGLYIAESYSMTLSTALQRQYNLTYAEQLNVAALFALYMCQMLSRDKDSRVMPPLFNACSWIGNQADLRTIADKAAPLSQDGLSVEKVCQLIIETGPERLRHFNSGIFYRACSNLGSDTISTRLAFEYPPYWVHQLILTMSGVKLSMKFPLTQHRLLDKKGKEFLRDLLYSKSFIDQLGR